MKKILRDLLFGVLIAFVINILSFLVSLPFEEPWEFSPGAYSYFVNRQLLLTALPAAITTFVFTALLKTKNKSEAIRRGIIWTIVLALYYVIIGIGNDNFEIIFSSIGLYVQLICAFCGAIFYY